MSLILEALKKLEREKQAPDRGFLVVAHVPWPSGPAGRSLWLGAGLALGLIGLTALLLLRGREVPPTTAKVPPVVTTPRGTEPSPRSRLSPRSPARRPPSRRRPSWHRVRPRRGR